MSTIVHLPAYFNTKPPTIVNLGVHSDQIFTHLVQAIAAELILNFLINQHAQMAFGYQPFNATRSAPFQQIPRPSFKMPQQKPQAERPNNSTRTTDNGFVDRTNTAVLGIQQIATQFDLGGKTLKEQQLVAEHLQTFQQAGTDTKRAESHEVLGTSITKLVRRLSLLIHPDKNKSPEAQEAFKQLNNLRDQFENARNPEVA